MITVVDGPAIVYGEGENVLPGAVSTLYVGLKLVLSNGIPKLRVTIKDEVDNFLFQGTDFDADHFDGNPLLVTLIDEAIAMLSGIEGNSELSFTNDYA